MIIVFHILPKLTIGTSKSFIQGKSLSVDGHTHTYNTITGKPSTFTPSSHIHNTSDITNLKEELEMVGSNGGKLVYTLSISNLNNFITGAGRDNEIQTTGAAGVVTGSRTWYIQTTCDYIVVYGITHSTSGAATIIEYPISKGCFISKPVETTSNNFIEWPVQIQTGGIGGTRNVNMTISLNTEGTAITMGVYIIGSSVTSGNVEVITNIACYKY